MFISLMIFIMTQANICARTLKLKKKLQSWMMFFVKKEKNRFQMLLLIMQEIMPLAS